jgi:phosphatidylglycerophosphate synthase
MFRDGVDVRDVPFESGSAILTEGVATLVFDEASRRAAERRLWASLTSSTDGIVDVYFNRPVGRYLSKILIHTPITPNQISILSMLIGLGAAWFFESGFYTAAVWGAVLLQISAIVDCVDGDIARILFKESRLGKWLDMAVDQVVHIAVFAGVAVGLARQDSPAPELVLGISTVVGVVISFAVVLRGMLRPSTTRNALVERLVDAATSRDFSVVLLALAVTGKLDWFLWIAAIGVHCFWVTALLVQLGPFRRSESVASPGA